MIISIKIKAINTIRRNSSRFKVIAKLYQPLNASTASIVTHRLESMWNIYLIFTTLMIHIPDGIREFHIVYAYDSYSDKSTVLSVRVFSSLSACSNIVFVSSR